MNNKLQAKDLINIGIFTTIYFVIYFCDNDAGIYSYSWCIVRTDMPYYMWNSVYALCYKSTELWDDFNNRNNFSNTLYSYGQRVISSILLCCLRFFSGHNYENGQIPEYEVCNNWICRFFYSDNGFF